MSSDQQKQVRWPLFLLMGCLSMFYAEILSGSSGYWFIDFWSLVIVFWLYLGHIVLFLNIAMRVKKTSPIHLYLYGVFFGLYESWITQVLWFGYYNEDPATVTMVAGIAITNTILLIFFWHPIFSFLLPVFIFEMFALQAPSNTPLQDRIFASHLRFLVNSKANNRKFLFLIVIGSFFVAFNYGGDLIKIIIVLLGSYGLIYLFKTQADKKCANNFSIKSLKLQSMTGLLVYLMILYAGMFFVSGVLGHRIPTIKGVITILVIYAVFSLVMMKTNPIEEAINLDPSIQLQCFNEPLYRKYMILNISLAILVGVLIIAAATLVIAITMVAYLSMMALGLIIVIRAILVRNRIENQIKFAEVKPTQALGNDREFQPLQATNTSSENVSNSSNFCINCGQKIQLPGIVFCPSCGKKIQ